MKLLLLASAMLASIGAPSFAQTQSLAAGVANEQSITSLKVLDFTLTFYNEHLDLVKEAERKERADVARFEDLEPGQGQARWCLNRKPAILRAIEQLRRSSQR